MIFICYDVLNYKFFIKFNFKLNNKTLKIIKLFNYLIYAIILINCFFNNINILLNDYIFKIIKLFIYKIYMKIFINYFNYNIIILFNDYFFININNKFFIFKYFNLLININKYI